MAKSSSPPIIKERYLSTAERDRFDKLEKVIQQGLQTFYEVGLALAEIRTSRLYREKYQNWDDYCEKKWGMQKTHVNRLIVSANVMENLTPMGVILPENERQIRPLTRIKDPAKQRQVWENVVRETEGDRKITAKLVEQEVKKVLPPKKSPKPKPQAPSEVREEPKEFEIDEQEAERFTPEMNQAFERVMRLVDEESRNNFASTSRDWIILQLEEMARICGLH